MFGLWKNSGNSLYFIVLHCTVGLKMEHVLIILSLVLLQRKIHR